MGRNSGSNGDEAALRQDWTLGPFRSSVSMKQRSNLTGPNPSSLAETVRGVGQSALLAVSRENPQLGSALGEWGSALRSDAQQRLEQGFSRYAAPSMDKGAFFGPLGWAHPRPQHHHAPPSQQQQQQQQPMGGEDWWLLRRAHRPQLLTFKRSASDNSLADSCAVSDPAPDAAEHGTGSGAHAWTAQQPTRPSVRKQQKRLSTGLGQSMRGSRRQRRPATPHSGDLLDPSASQLVSSEPYSETLPAHAAWPSSHAAPRHSHSLDLDLARGLSALVDSSSRALRTARSSIAETAANCQHNLAALSNMLQQNMAANASTLQDQAYTTLTRSMATRSDPFAGALSPWTVFPMYLKAREHAMAVEAANPATAPGPYGAPSPAPSLSSTFSAGALTPSPSAALGTADDGAAAALDPSNLDGVGASTCTALTAAPSASTLQPTPPWALPLELLQQHASREALRAAARRRSLREAGRQVAIVTTASLPWLTGTAVNPLLRAAYLSSDGSRRKVTLVLPWLSAKDQERVFPNGMHFDTPEQQEDYVRDWARRRTGLDCNFRICFYPGRYAAEKGSILPVGDITQVIPDHEADVAVLEEPEHLNWYHHGKRWTDKFNHVVGIMHTNYLDYARREEGGHIKEQILKHINAWVCRIHCHKVIKLSDAVQKLSREDTMFVHGVSPSFLKVGQHKAQQMQQGDPERAWGKGVYFIGKVLWAKGYTELLQRLSEHAQRTGEYVPVDVYGGGPDLKVVEAAAAERKLNLSFKGPRDHADHSLQDYKVFVNPSLSDVVATTTAEALAMGKWVVCADHPSNRFFARFPNCLVYRNSDEFSTCLKRALSMAPRPLGPEELKALTWEAATERFLDMADQHKPHPPLEAALDNVLHAAHNLMTGIEFLRVLSGAGAKTRDLPARVTDYTPCEDDVGGFFDNHARAKQH